MLARNIFILLLPILLSTFICEGQNTLVLDNYKVFGFKRIRFCEGDIITFRLHDFKKRYNGEILLITDSTIAVKGMEIPLKMIDVVYIERGNFLTKSFSHVFIWCGLGFILLDTGNNLIANRPTVVENRAVVAGGSLIVLGLTMKAITHKKYKIGNRNTLKVFAN